MIGKGSTVCRSSELVDAKYNLSLMELRLIILATSKITAIDGDDFNAAEWIHIDVSEYCSVFEIKPSGKNYLNIKNAAQSLYDRRVLLPTSSKATLHKTRWVQDCKYRDYDGAIALRFTESIKPHLVDLDQYIKYKLGEFAKLTSIYAARLFEFVLKWEKAGSKTVPLEDIREMLDAINKYTDVGNFRFRVIEPAIKQINARTSVKIKHTYVKTKRTITHIKFDIKTSEKKIQKLPTEKQFYTYVDIKKLKGLEVCYEGESWEMAYDRMVTKGTEASHKEIIDTIKKFKKEQEQERQSA